MACMVDKARAYPPKRFEKSAFLEKFLLDGLEISALLSYNFS